MGLRGLERVALFVSFFVCFSISESTFQPGNSLALAAGGKVKVEPKIFDVRNYGAVSGGYVDNSQAFLKAWDEACKTEGRSRVYIPTGTFKTGPVIFKGPCKGTINFVIRGVLTAPTDRASLSFNHWINFRYIDGLIISGGGVLEGQGKSAWALNDCTKNSNCRLLPYSVGLDFVTNSKVHHITSIDSKNVHFNLYKCNNVNIYNIKLVAPDESPNTDGIRIGYSTGIQIYNSDIGTGDDCIAIINFSENINITKVNCGPGHGISVGSLGKNVAGETIKGLTVKDCTFTNTQNGVRIKTWASPFSGAVLDFWFENIIMNNVYNPIIIDQQYCPNSGCSDKITSQIQIDKVTFKNIRGTSLSKVAVNLNCSPSRPCRNVVLQDIDLVYNGKEGPAAAFCSNVKGLALGKHNPASCV